MHTGCPVSAYVAPFNSSITCPAAIFGESKVCGRAVCLEVDIGEQEQATLDVVLLLWDFCSLRRHCHLIKFPQMLYLLLHSQARYDRTSMLVVFVLWQPAWRHADAQDNICQPVQAVETYLKRLNG